MRVLLFLAAGLCWFLRGIVVCAEDRAPASPSEPSGIRLGGSLSLNWRNIGPRFPGFEKQIQDEVYLADTFFSLEGPRADRFPFFLEFQIPTGSEGKPNLYRFSLDLLPRGPFDFKLGKFLVPFGHYNELYRPDQFLTVTRPLLYASPDSLDLVVRLNSPRPPFSSGYTDIGAKAGYRPSSEHAFVPTDMTVYVVNGFGEASNRQRTFPSPSDLHVPPPPVEGVSIDFGHQNNDLADNNNNKTVGGRVSFALGDLRLPLPIPESRREMKGVILGLSYMSGRYDLEQTLGYRIFGADTRFQYLGFSVNAEYVYSDTDFRSPQADTGSAVDFTIPTSQIPASNEINQGYYIQAAFPILKHPPVGRSLSGILEYNRMQRRGPQLVFSSNKNSDGVPVAAFPTTNNLVTTHINKYTLALHHQWTENIQLKAEYSYWDISVPPVNGDVQSNVYQTALSIVFSF